MIYLSAQHRSAFNEVTFWVWFENTFSNTSYKLPKKYNKDDIILRYSTMPPISIKPGKTIALCWELYPEMQKALKTTGWEPIVQNTYKVASKADRITVASRFSVPYYEKFGKVDVLPIGVDTDLFSPVSEEEKNRLKLKYNVPMDKEIGFWCGTMKEIKGSSHFQKYANQNPNIYWIVVWYPRTGSIKVQGQHHTVVNQQTMSELMNCADFQLSTNILRPYYIIEYEGMSCNLPQRNILNIERDFPTGDSPRDAIFKNKWERHTCKAVWEEYIVDTL